MLTPSSFAPCPLLSPLQIEFPHPSESSRVDILKIHSRKMNLTRGIDLKKVCMSPGGGVGRYPASGIFVFTACLTTRRAIPRVGKMAFSCQTRIQAPQVYMSNRAPPFQCAHAHPCMTTLHLSSLPVNPPNPTPPRRPPIDADEMGRSSGAELHAVLIPPPPPYTPLHPNRPPLPTPTPLFPQIADKMGGSSGAELKAVCTEAGMFALRERRVHVTQVGLWRVEGLGWGVGLKGCGGPWVGIWTRVTNGAGYT